ncbi:MAG TPA: hypothetical protein VHO06_20205 [Polyangia bacterium]|nr:hypothetical protein [Polyangia bacterium]
MPEPAHPWRLRGRLSEWAAVLPVLALVLWVFAPFFADVRMMGFQDWDSQAAYRYITVLSVKRYGQPPWWDPWYCGGFPAWGFLESGTNFVSPFAPLYFLFSFPLALRLEAVAAALVGVLGTFLLAGRFTRSPAWRAFVAAIWILCSRWALQISAGHLWHLSYAWVPFALYFFDRALEERRWQPAAAAGAFLALIVYLGGIYPYPHALMLFGLYALGLAIARRGLWPLGLLGVAVGSSVGLAAPKLMPVLATMLRFPRLIDSNEPISLHSLWVILTAHQQGFDFYPRLPVRVFWPWWDWGAYVGVAGALALAAALAVGWSPRLLALKVAGLVFLVLALGQSIWSLVHEFPIFSSWHLPARMLFPAILVLALVLVGGLDAAWAAVARRRRWAEAVALAVVSLYAFDLAVVARQATPPPFRLTIPKVTPSAEFRQERSPGYRYGKPAVGPALRDRYEWPSKIVYPSMLANTGVIACYGVPPEVHPAAIGADQPGYRGLVFLAAGPGQAALTRWTPNAVTVRITGGRAGDLLVYDMNFDPGWRADGGPAERWHGLVAARLAGGDQTVELQYRPYGLGLGLALFGLTLATFAALKALAVVRRRRGV